VIDDRLWREKRVGAEVVSPMIVNDNAATGHAFAKITRFENHEGITSLLYNSEARR
jgi:hypothetical protein